MKKLICTVLASAMLLPIAVQAKEWVNLSSWAYNEVSNFTSEGLLPESFENISEYRVNITREQFCELLCSVMIKTGIVSQPDILNYYSDTSYFADCNNRSVSVLASYDIVNGVTETEKDEDMYDGNVIKYFLPQNEITREDAAVMIFRLGSKYGTSNKWYRALAWEDEENSKGDVILNLQNLTDYDEVSDYALNAVDKLTELGIISGNDKNEFDPKGKLTIEQAISLIYRLYKIMPQSPLSDGSEIYGSEETHVQYYANGLNETKKDNVLYLKNNDEILMSFETDIYSNIFCNTVNETVYAAAQNYNKTTEVYNAVNNEFLFTVPYTLRSLESDYIITQSDNVGRRTFGLYSYSGEEILPPQYSLEELEVLKNNNFEIPQYEKREADGWIYFADWSDGGHMYKVDSNGENLQKLSDEDCYNIVYVDGWIFYSVRGENEGKLYCMRSDGSDNQLVMETQAALFDRASAYYERDNSFVSTNVSCVYIGKYLFIVSDGSLYKLWFDGSVAKTEPIAEAKSLTYSDNIQYSSGDKLYFKPHAHESDYIYATDGETTKCISGEYKAKYFHIAYDGNIWFRIENDETFIIDLETGNIRPSNQEELFGYTLSDRIYAVTSKTEDYDDRYKVYWTPGYSSEHAKIAYEFNGEETVIYDRDWSGVCRHGNDVYYNRQDYETNNTGLYRYNLITREDVPVITDNTYYSGMEIIGDCIIYSDISGMQWRYNINDGSSIEIYPNKGILNKYGKVYKISGLLKTDTEGNKINLLNDVNPAYATYIPNGAVTEELYLQ